jgi:hypothetical protein
MHAMRIGGSARAHNLTDVLLRPFGLRTTTAAGRREHIPDFLAVTRRGTRLVDVRTRPIKHDDQMRSSLLPRWRWRPGGGMGTWLGHVGRLGLLLERGRVTAARAIRGPGRRRRPGTGCLRCDPS